MSDRAGLDLSGARIQLADLTGLHALHGIWRGEIAFPNSYNGDADNGTALVLWIDDDIVVFLERANDGYRSELGDVYRLKTDAWSAIARDVLQRDPPSLSPIHPPLIVQMRVRECSKYEWSTDRADVLYAINEQTDLCVLEVGTENIDDWYPSFVCQWQPEGWTLEWITEAMERDERIARDGGPAI